MVLHLCLYIMCMRWTVSWFYMAAAFIRQGVLSVSSLTTGRTMPPTIYQCCGVGETSETGARLC